MWCNRTEWVEFMLHSFLLPYFAIHPGRKSSYQLITFYSLSHHFYTFSCVCRVVQRWWVVKVVGRHLLRGTPDPVKAIAQGELVPATRPTLKVTFRGWIGRTGRNLSKYSFICGLENNFVTKISLQVLRVVVLQLLITSQSSLAERVCSVFMEYPFFWQQWFFIPDYSY